MRLREDYDFTCLLKQSSGGVLENFAKFTGKHLCQSLFFNKVAGLVLVTLLKTTTLEQVFFCKFCEIFKNTSAGWFWKYFP